MENYIGRLLDNRYEILEIIGTGGMAVVYKSRDHRLKRLVAVKILKNEYSEDEEFRRRFKAESQAVAMLSHANIVSIYDVNSFDGVDYIVMELIDGISLKQYMDRRGQMNWRETLHFGMQICKALEHAHSRGIVHRDIKPHNIMILKDGSVKVADFGIARMAASQNTLTREALGSVHYISPEQAKGGKVDCRSDLYSLGVVMYEMMTAKPPFDAETPVAVAIQHINGTAQKPREMNPDIPEGLEQITMRAMKADANERYNDATEMLNDLEEFRKNPDIVFYFADPARSTSRTGAGRTGSGKQTQKDAGQRRRNAARNDMPEQDDMQDEQEARHGAKGIIALVVLLVAAVIGAAYLVVGVLLPWLNQEAAKVKVPDFVGKHYSEITPADYPEFTLAEQEWVYHDELDFGYVVDQTPEGDTESTSGTAIHLTLSLGRKDSAMPNLIGMDVDRATQLLNDMDLGLLVVLENAPSDSYEKGKIINSDPVEGIRLEAGQTVMLMVSSGSEESVEAEKTIVPNVCGRSVTEAISILGAEDLSVGSVIYVDSDQPKDVVVSQNVDDGTEVEVNSGINLEVSNGLLAEEETEEPEETEDEIETIVPEETDPETEETPDVDEEPITETETETVPDGEESGENSIKVAIYLPQTETGVVQVQLYLDGVLVSDDADVSCDDIVINAQLTGVGTQLLEVYFDGVKDETQSQQVTFG